MRTIKRLLAAGLAAAMLGSVPAYAAGTDGLDHFQPVAAYSDGLFTDLDAGGWYMENVKTAYELGLMKGVGSGSFSPDGTISLGETIALAARVHSIYETGEANFTQGSPWYQVYVDYAAENGIFTGSATTNYGAPATRSQFAAILAAALPEEALEPINTVDDGMIPDVPVGAANYDAIYLLYRAGVLTGSDGKGTYNPETSIGRSSVAALVTRMVKPELRQSITLEDESAELKVTLNRTSLTLTEGDTQKLTATVRPVDAGVTVTWSSSNTSVASVASDGTVTARNAGTATITAKAGDASAKCTVTVAEKVVEVTSITITQVSLKLDVGETSSLSAFPSPSTATDRTVQWSTSNSAVATVSLREPYNNGSYAEVTAAGEGTCTITARTSNGVSAACQVTVGDVIEEEEPDDEPYVPEDTDPSKLMFNGEFIPRGFGASSLGSSTRHKLNGAYLLFMEEQGYLRAIDGYSYAGTFEVEDSHPYSGYVTYTVDNPGVVEVFSSHGGSYCAAFDVNPVGPGTATVTATTREDSTTVDFLVPDTSVVIEGTKRIDPYLSYNWNGLEYTLEDDFTFGPASIYEQMQLQLVSYTDSYAAYELTMRLTNTGDHDITVANLMMDTGSGRQLVQSIYADVVADWDAYTVRFQVPRGQTATLSFETDPADSLSLLTFQPASLPGLGASYASIGFTGGSEITEEGCTFNWELYIYDADKMPNIVTIWLVDKGGHLCADKYYIELDPEDIYDGAYITGTGFMGNVEPFKVLHPEFHPYRA